MNEKAIILATFASMVLAACTTGMKMEEEHSKPFLTNHSSPGVSIPGEQVNTPPVGHAMICTMDAKLCPDGSYVSRNAANNCAFNPCPGGPK